MSSENGLENKGALPVIVITWVCAMVMAVCISTAIISLQGSYETDEYQAALHITNWTNLTLNITVFVYANDWTTFDVALNHTENVTLTITWQDIKETIVFIHSVGPGVYSTLMYTMEAGQWRTVLLV